MPTAKQEFEKLFAEIEPTIAEAFMIAIANAATDAPFKRVVKLFAAGNIEAAIDLLDLEPAALGNLYAALANAYNVAGQAAAKAAPINVKFDISDPIIDAHLKAEVGGLIREITEESRQNIRDVLADSFATGDNPTRTVQRIVGKRNPVTGKREGGIIGLTQKQSKWVSNARRQLTELDAAYFNREARDKRHDRTVRKAIKNDKPLTQTQIDNIVGNYSNKLLKKRAEDIALTETMTAINSTKIETFKKAARQQKIKLEWVDKVWHSSGDSRVRDTHRALDGTRVKFNESFVSRGFSIAYPCDPTAPASERIRCRCWLQLKVNTKRRFGVSED